MAINPGSTTLQTSGNFCRFGNIRRPDRSAQTDISGIGTFDCILDIALTSRGTDPDGSKIPLAGVPHHAAPGYLAALLRHREKVATGDQMGDAPSARGAVPRPVSVSHRASVTQLIG